MITLELARELNAVGVLWQPAAGDRFVVDQESLHAEVFWISELVVEVQSSFGTPLLGFNGTTEWALDSVDLDQALWLPREDQLRELLGERFVSLTRDAPTGDWLVSAQLDEVVQFRHADVECAYAAAVLAIA